MRRSRHHWLFTVAAVFLLLFTAGDLAYPQMCAEDGGDSASAVLSASSALTIGAPAPASTDSPAHADDCFCCCGHVVAAPLFHIATPNAAAESRLAQTAQRLSMAPPVAFHPPKTA